MTPLRQRMIDDMTLHGLKPKTIKAYVPCVSRFARYFGKSPTLLGTPEIRAYLLYLTHEKHVSASTYNQYLCALKFLYRITLGRQWGLDGLARTRRQIKLPVVLSLEEVTLARYTHRVAISNARLLDFEDGMVRFRYKDYAHGNRKRVMTLTALEFVRRLLLHVLPTGFMRIRHYGILANRHRHEKLALCRRLLDSDSAIEPKSPETEEIPESPSSVTPTQVCPVCGAGRMIVIEEFPPLPAGRETHEMSAPRRGFDSS
jgi:Putative transposase/Phage integrase, N-terminal SAM-like domain